MKNLVCHRLIVNITQAERFLIDCCDSLGLGFHPDTLGDDYVNENGESTFSPTEAQVFNHNMHNAFLIFEEEGKDIYEFCLNYTQI